MLIGYCQLKQINQTANFVIYQGVREEDNLPVVIKLTEQDCLDTQTINRYRREYEIISCLRHPDIVTAYELILNDRQLAIVLEDFSGESLANIISENLTQELPFQSSESTSESTELIQAQIAKALLSPQQINPEIPQPVAEIVLKLMAENPEDRYQSAAGIKHDLEICLEQLSSCDRIAKFELGQKDLGEKLTGDHDESSLAQLASQIDLELESCPGCTLYKKLLIQAEKACLDDNKAEAIDDYDRAIAEAKILGLSNIAALAHELAAKFYLNWGKPRLAAEYML